MKRFILSCILIILLFNAVTLSITQDHTQLGNRATLYPVNPLDQSEWALTDMEIVKSMQSTKQPLRRANEISSDGTTFTLSWRQLEIPRGGFRFAVPGDSLAQWFVPLSACTLRTVRIYIINFEGEMILGVYKSNYDGQIESEEFTNANGWIGTWEDSIWIPGTNPLMEVSPLGERVWGPDTITVTSDNHNSWLEIPTSVLGDPDLGNSPFMIGFEMNQTGTDRIAYERGITPYHFFKYYASFQSPSGNSGWHIRSISMWVEAEVSYYGDIPPLFENPRELVTTTSSDPRSVSVQIVDFNPSGGEAGIDLAEVRYSVNEGDQQSASLSDFDGDSIYTGNLPGFQPGDEIVYHYWARDVEGNEARTKDFIYAILKVEDPILVIYNESTLYNGCFPHSWMQQFYFFGYGGYEWSNDIVDSTVYRYDLWDGAQWGSVTAEILENYDVVVQLDNQFPANDNSPQLLEWISAGTPENPRRLFLASQDYPWRLNPADPNPTFQPGSFEYDYLGIERIEGDINTNDPISLRGFSGNPISGFIADYSDTTGLFFKYTPGPTLGHYQWIDYVYPTAASDTAFVIDDGETYGVSGVHHEGPGFKSIFLAFDPLGCVWTNDADTTVWIIDVDNIIGKALEWFNAPLGQSEPPTLVVEPMDLDFGSVAVGDTAVLQLHLINGGTAPLEIFDIDVTTPLVTVTDTACVIAPGDTFISILFFAPKLIEPLEEEIMIKSDDPASPSLIIPIVADVLPAIVAISPYDINFGLVHLGAKDTLQFEISNSGQSPLEIYAITSTNDVFSVSETTLTVLAGSAAILDAYFTPTEVGLEGGNFILASNDPSTPEVIINCEGIGFDPEQLTPEPQIIAVNDVPNDQGREVRILWTRSVIDEESAGLTLTHYTVWRQSPSLDDAWDFVGSIDAIHFDLYGFVAPTLGDSTIDGIFWSEFKVAAHTDDPQIFYISAPVAGYSTDDLSPQVPLNVKANPEGEFIILTWQMVIDADFAYYSVYRSITSHFYPDTAYATVTDTTFTDALIEQGVEYFYRISAFDFAGNESNYSAEVSIVVTEMEPTTFPDIFELSQNYPNPFNQGTTIQYKLPTSAYVTLSIYNISGQLITTLIREQKDAGYHSVQWDASQFSSGIYIYWIQADGFSAVKKCILMK